MALFKSRDPLAPARDAEAAATRELQEAELRLEIAAPSFANADDFDSAIEPYTLAIDRAQRKLKVRRLALVAGERQEAERHASALEREDRSRRKATVQLASGISKSSETISSLLNEAVHEWRRLNTGRERILGLMPRAWRENYGNLTLAHFQEAFLLDLWRLGAEPGGPNPLAKRPAGLLQYELNGDGHIPSLAENLKPILDAVKVRMGAAPAGDLVVDLKPKPIKPEIVPVVPPARTDAPPAGSGIQPLESAGVAAAALPPPIAGVSINMRGGNSTITNQTVRQAPPEPYQEEIPGDAVDEIISDTPELIEKPIQEGGGDGATNPPSPAPARRVGVIRRKTSVVAQNET